MNGREEDQRAADTQRVDKWLWFARVSKSRTLAATLVEAGKVRVNRQRVLKPSQTVRPGDVLTIALGGKVQVLKVLSPGSRRGPPPEARLLYEVLSAAASPVVPGAPARGERPSKRERRQHDKLNDPDEV